MSKKDCPLEKKQYEVIGRIADFRPAAAAERRPGGVVFPGNNRVRYANVVSHEGQEYLLWEDELDCPVIDEIPKLPVLVK